MKTSTRRWDYVIFFIVEAILLSSGCALVRDLWYISEEEAIEIARRECTIEGSNMDTYNVEAELMTWEEASERLDQSVKGEHARNTKAWFVSMDGPFFVYPPDSSEPLEFPHCFIILDAKTGDLMLHVNKIQ